MLAYPIQIEEDGDTVMATSPDFPELTTFGDDRDEALVRASDALEEAIAARIYTGQEIPTPSQGDNCVALPALTSVKAILYQGMTEQGISKAELARRLGWRLPQVDCALDLESRSRLDHMDAALAVIGRRLYVGASAPE